MKFDVKTLAIKPPRTPRGIVRVTMMAEVTVAEIYHASGHWVLHLPHVADKLSTAEKTEVLARGSEEASRLNALTNITNRLTK